MANAIMALLANIYIKFIIKTLHTLRLSNSAFRKLRMLCASCSYLHSSARSLFSNSDFEMHWVYSLGCPQLKGVKAW